jgi:hypothetical protein
MKDCWGLRLLVPFVTSLLCSNVDAAVKVAPRVQSARPSENKIELLIAQLRSPNEDPNPNSKPVHTFPKNYDFQAQQKVAVAYRRLVNLGKDAFPILIRHMNELHYSRSKRIAVLSSQSVGRVCYAIIEKQVDIVGMTYKSRIGSDGHWHRCRRYFSQFSANGEYYTQEGLSRWWKKYHHLSIRALQIEVLLWGIDREQRIGFPEKGDKARYLNPLLIKLFLILVHGALIHGVSPSG